LGSLPSSLLTDLSQNPVPIKSFSRYVSGAKPFSSLLIQCAKVNIAGLNPHDLKAKDNGLFIQDHLPAVLTNDVVGTVVELGPGVTKYQIGDRVLSHASFDASFNQPGLQEYALNDIGAGFKIPESVSNEEAATLPTAIIAPLFGLFATGKGMGIPAPWTEEAKSFEYSNTILLVVGGGSSCGKYAIQLAKLAGIGKVVSVGGEEEELKSYGATDVLDRHGGFDAVLESIRSVVGDDLVYAFDAVNPPDGQLLGLNALSSTKKGRFARLLPLGPVDENKVVGKKAGFEVIDVFGSSQVLPQVAYPFWERVPEYLISGKIKPLEFVVKHGLTAENVNEGLDAYKAGGRVVKTLIKF
jgi:NADPH:quinone reductase